jgi:hypothetical protein
MLEAFLNTGIVMALFVGIIILVLPFAYLASKEKMMKWAIIYIFFVFFGLIFLSEYAKQLT